MSRTDRPAVLVTGGARRLGREIARTLATAGWDVALHCHRSVDEAQALATHLRTLGVDADVFAADLSDEAACRALLPAAATRFPRLQAVINNASTFEHDDAFSTGPASMARHWQANTAAPVLLAQALHGHLSADATAQGCVVNLLDQKLWNPNPDHFAYTLSKAALREATVMLAQAMAPRLRVCAVAPGVTLPSGPMTEAEFNRAHAMTPLQRSSTPEDIAGAVRFLLESPAITGTTLLVDGGQHLSPQPRDVYYLVAEQP